MQLRNSVNKRETYRAIRDELIRYRDNKDQIDNEVLDVLKDYKPAKKPEVLIGMALGTKFQSKKEEDFYVESAKELGVKVRVFNNDRAYLKK